MIRSQPAGEKRSPELESARLCKSGLDVLVGVVQGQIKRLDLVGKSDKTILATFLGRRIGDVAQPSR